MMATIVTAMQAGDQRILEMMMSMDAKTELARSEQRNEHELKMAELEDKREAKRYKRDLENEKDRNESKTAAEKEKQITLNIQLKMMQCLTNDD